MKTIKNMNLYKNIMENINLDNESNLYITDYEYYTLDKKVVDKIIEKNIDKNLELIECIQQYKLVVDYCYDVELREEIQVIYMNNDTEELIYECIYTNKYELSNDELEKYNII